jgi:small subunit ribosomal protein S14
MPKQSLVAKAKKPKRYLTREYSRCQICGRQGGFMRKFKMCRICFREHALKGEIPGVQKSSW